jgi:NAD(P)-dependent dehydrogenase (short-subunit alcohol dehydrogenase family)
MSSDISDAVITGASTGIGRGTVKVLIGHGWRVFAGVRKSNDAASLRQEFGESVVPLLFDVTDAAAVRAAAAEARKRLAGRPLKGLVNNAGMGLGGPLMHQPVDELRRLFEVNVLGTIAVTQAFLPLLGADHSLSGGPGRIVNTTSIGGKVALPFLGNYAMSKFAVEAFGESLRRELMIYGIDVITIGPGAVATPIWDKAERADDTGYARTDYAAALSAYRNRSITEGRKGLPPERVGHAIHHALTARKPRVRYTVVRRRLYSWTIPMLLPKRLMDRIVAKQFGLTASG